MSRLVIAYIDYCLGIKGDVNLRIRLVIRNRRDKVLFLPELLYELTCKYARESLAASVSLPAMGYLVESVPVKIIKI